VITSFARWSFICASEEQGARARSSVETITTSAVGAAVGAVVGAAVGEVLGAAVVEVIMGSTVGAPDGCSVGSEVEEEGAALVTCTYHW
jgi:uncharacterized protein YcfJ